ncbi:terpenoid synthase [Armillaria solidipes]|uniref:(2E,6E)-farnesyl diphosphate synthase n=1 Tax=Armillaria solidipes TaxID=1076256 RepID=A0A2H3AWQ6_9AGAR|nr:terpenoid synthase [Armillaria solidipes]
MATATTTVPVASSPPAAPPTVILQVSHSPDAMVENVHKFLLASISSPNVALEELASYYALKPSKRMRPRLILLIAMASGAKDNDQLNDTSCYILDTHIQFASAIELVHMASLLHDDVLDQSDLRRGQESAPKRFGMKQSILAGDYILGKIMRISLDIGNSDVAGEIASLISELVEGEINQLSDIHGLGPSATKDMSLASSWSSYLRTIQLKTAVLIARAARCAVKLHPSALDSYKQDAYEFGQNLGIAFQIVDDLLDFTGDKALGKPANGNDLKEGIITAPILFGAEENEEIRSLFLRRFFHPQDTERALALLPSTSAFVRTENLARDYAKKARLSISGWPHSPAKMALEALTNEIVKRKN